MTALTVDSPCATRQCLSRVYRRVYATKTTLRKHLLMQLSAEKGMASQEQNSLESEDGISLLHEKILQVSSRGNCGRVDRIGSWDMQRGD